MIKYLFIYLFLIGFFACELTAKTGIIIEDFNSGKISGYGAWEKDPDDKDESASVELVNHTKIGNEGYSLKITYDVDSPEGAYNGLWLKIAEKNFSGYESLKIAIKGDPTVGFTKVIKCELKNAYGEVGVRYIREITDKWKKFELKFSEFKGLTKLKKITEFVLVFEDKLSDPMTGAIFIDNIFVGEYTVKEKASASKLKRMKRSKPKTSKKAVKTIADLIAQEKGLTVKKIDRDIIINFQKTVAFKTGRYDFVEGSEDVLLKVRDLLRKMGKYRISIESHTDNGGSPKMNRKLSRKRAIAVANFLVRNGISQNRILSVIGHGPDKPIESNDTEQGRSKNRRTELIILR